MSSAFARELETDPAWLRQPALCRYVQAELALADAIEAKTIDRTQLQKCLQN